MLPKNKRITKELFKDIMKNGRILSSPFFVFRYIRSKEPHYAFVVPKTVAKLAKDRNKLRRRGYSSLIYKDLLAISGIFFYKKEGKNAQIKDIKSDVSSILKKIKP